MRHAKLAVSAAATLVTWAISCFNLDMETLSFGIDVALREQNPESYAVDPPINLQPPAPSATIVNTAPRAAPKCSRPVETLFTIAWNTYFGLIAVAGFRDRSFFFGEFCAPSRFSGGTVRCP